MARRPSPAPQADPVRERLADAFLNVPPTDLRPNVWNPRKRQRTGSLDALLESVRAVGVLEPILARPTHEVGTYEVVAGARRLAAALLADVATVPIVVKDLTDAEALEVALTENVQRADMHVLDEAEAYRTLQERDRARYTLAGIARRIGQPEGHVYRRLRLLQLSKGLQTALEEDRLALGHAEELVRLPAPLQTEAIEEGLVWRTFDLEGRGEILAKATRDDLAPLVELKRWVSRRTAVDPLSADTKYFQPAFSADVDTALRPGTDGEQLAAEAAEVEPSIVALSEATLVRSDLRAPKGDKVPLSPSQWREVGKKDCAFAQVGAVVHGGDLRVVRVCLKRSCPVHWPKPKSTKAKAGKTGVAPVTEHDAFEAKQAREKAAREAFTALLERGGAAVGAHFRKVKISARLVTRVLSHYDIERVKRCFGVTLTDQTAVAVLALYTVETYDRASFDRSVKGWKFNTAAWAKKFPAPTAGAAS